ncbi:MAG: DUF4351 domain-containing protein [Phormidium tanganyikae FI6-MK23]|jgi:hypothetical protein|nr:DUF4351 domain-containing protein [Phormidium tanganyikae FI6-MK23]
MAQLSQAYLDWKRETQERAMQQGIEQGRSTLITVMLERRFGILSAQSRDRISRLNLDQLEALAIALLDFSTIENLEAWLSHAIAL